MDQRPSSQSHRKREVSEREVQQHMTSEVALSALGIGLNVERVKRAIRLKLEQTGCGYSQADALVEAALNLQYNEEDISNDSNLYMELDTRNLIKNVVVENVLDKVIVKNCDVNADRSADSDTVLEESGKNDNKSLEEENRILKEARLCKICMDNEVGIVFLPCGHLATCVTCAPNLEDCPVCRSSIKATVRTFLS